MNCQVRWLSLRWPFAGAMRTPVATIVRALPVSSTSLSVHGVSSPRKDLNVEFAVLCSLGRVTPGGVPRSLFARFRNGLPRLLIRRCMALVRASSSMRHARSASPTLMTSLPQTRLIREGKGG